MWWCENCKTDLFVVHDRIGQLQCSRSHLRLDVLQAMEDKVSGNHSYLQREEVQIRK